jgi:hypothetical protein
MQLITRNLKLLRELPALRIQREEFQFHARIHFRQLLFAADTLLPSLYEHVERKLRSVKPRKFASSSKNIDWTLQLLRSRSPGEKTKADWQVQVELETEEYCQRINGVQALMAAERLYHERKPSSSWDIRRHLDITFMQKSWPNREDREMVDDQALNGAIEDDDAVKILNEWAKLNKVNLFDMTEAGIRTVVGWRTLKSLEDCRSSGYFVRFKRHRKYLFIFHRHACSPEQAYRIVDVLNRSEIQSAVALLDPDHSSEHS